MDLAKLKSLESESDNFKNFSQKQKIIIPPPHCNCCIVQWLLTFKGNYILGMVHIVGHPLWIEIGRLCALAWALLSLLWATQEKHFSSQVFSQKTSLQMLNLDITLSLSLPFPLVKSIKTIWQTICRLHFAKECHVCSFISCQAQLGGTIKSNSILIKV